MKIAVVGSGYVGTTLAAGLAEIGHEVIAIDIDESIVEAINAGTTPVHEPGLAAAIDRHAGTRLRATTDYAVLSSVDLAFIAVQTPSTPDGAIDVSVLETATHDAAAAMNAATDPGLLVIKSTVTPPQLQALIDSVSGEYPTVELATNPEFLREGSAVHDFHHPDKIVFGTDSETALSTLRNAFLPIIEAVDPVIIETDPVTAAMIKYANNAFLATKISLINELGNICKSFGIDAYEVAEAIGTDHRISEEFLRSGVGFGGACFPKDVDALIAAATDAGYDPELLSATMSVNDGQPDRMLNLLDKHVDVRNKPVAVLGLAFKPGTDDIRNSRAIPIIEGLLDRGATVIGYDPVAAENMQEEFPDITYADSANDALDGAVGALVVTDWDEFAALAGAFCTMAKPVVIDGRRIIEESESIIYEGLTW